MFFVLYVSVVPGVSHWYYIGIPLVFWGVPLVFWVMFSYYATVPGCSAIPPVFSIPLFCVSVFLVLYYAQLEDMKEASLSMYIACGGRTSTKELKINEYQY